MKGFKEKYDDIVNKGYVIDLYEEERNFPITGKYKAYCVSIKKYDKVILNHYSKKSTEDALIVAHEMMQITKYI